MGVISCNTASSDGFASLMPPVLKTQIRATFLHLLKLSFFFTVITIQAFLIAHGCKPIATFFPLSLLFAFLALDRYLSRPFPVYLVDFSCLRPSPSYRVPFAGFLEHTSGLFDKESAAFMAKIISSSGQSEETCLPPSLHYLPPKTDLHESIKEAHLLLFPVMDDLLSKTKITPIDVDILVLNCSGFCPSPSLTSVLVNHYRMRTDVKTFNLSGMGCSAGAIGIDLARNALQNESLTYAVVLSAEMISTGWYPGKDKRKLLLNCVFRMGSSAVLLTNKASAREASKYKLARVLRITRAADDKAYLSGIRDEDSEGITGFSIERNLLQVAAETLRANITLLAKDILPATEKMKYVLSVVRQKLFNQSPEPYVPNFGSAIQHFCIPVSGLAVIKEIGNGLKLRQEAVEPAVMTLHRFGNQSASSMWYEIAYMEAKGRMKKGDKVWQLWMGTGPKCNSVVWECLRTLEDEGKKGPWFDCIHRYPVKVTGIQSFAN